MKKVIIAFVIIIIILLLVSKKKTTPAQSSVQQPKPNKGDLIDLQNNPVQVVDVNDMLNTGGGPQIVVIPVGYTQNNQPLVSMQSFQQTEHIALNQNY